MWSYDAALAKHGRTVEQQEGCRNRKELDRVGNGGRHTGKTHAPNGLGGQKHADKNNAREQNNRQRRNNRGELSDSDRKESYNDRQTEQTVAWWSACANSLVATLSL